MIGRFKLLTTNRPYSLHRSYVEGLDFFFVCFKYFTIIHDMRTLKEHIRPVVWWLYNIFVLHTITKDYVLRLKVLRAIVIVFDII